MKNPKVAREGTPELLLLQAVILDAGLRCGRDLSRDLKVVERRLRSEGHTFLHRALPAMATLLEASLDKGAMEPIPVGMRQRNGLPLFLYPLWEDVFSPYDGRVLDLASEDCVLAIRQICRLFKKIEVPPTTKQEMDMFHKYVATDQELAGWKQNADSEGFFESPIYKLFGAIGDMLWTHTLADADATLREYRAIPKHGPGATADKLVGNGKWRSMTWYRRLDKAFPCSSYLVSDLGYDIQKMLSIGISSEEPCVNVTVVPKTPGNPRVIAVEPAAMQYTQQAVRDVLYTAVEDNDLLRNCIGFRDQTRNQEHAREGSRNGKIATLDLSEASDRVHMKLVARMFRALPFLRRCLFATRTPYAYLKGLDRKIQLSKFASMGSATCFPVETMLFLQIVVTAAAWADGCRSVDGLGVKQISRLISHHAISVFGDDITISLKAAETAADFLEAFGLKVNRDKSFGLIEAASDVDPEYRLGRSTGLFRESCGADWFGGIDVKPVYIRKPFPSDERDASEVEAMVSTSNQLFERGWWLSADYLRHYLNSVIGNLPLGGDDLGCLHYSYRARQMYGPRKWSSDIQAWKYRVYVSRPKVVKDELSNEQALLKFHINAERSGNVGLFNDRSAQLDSSSEPYSAKLYRKWLAG